MTEPKWAILITSGERFLCEWSGSLEAVEQLYRHAHATLGLDVRDHHWAWEGRAREIVWDAIVNGQDLTNDECAVLIWWVVHYSLGNVLAPIATCIFRRHFNIGLGHAENRCTWVDVTPCTTLRDPPPGFVAFTFGI